MDLCPCIQSSLVIETFAMRNGLGFHIMIIIIILIILLLYFIIIYQFYFIMFLFYLLCYL